MKTHIKRIAAPRTWPILRKDSTFVTRPRPRGQSLDLMLPVVVVLRDMLGVVEDARQARRVMHTQGVLVNGRNVYKTRDSVGFMDIITLGSDSYRIVINKNNQLDISSVKKGEEFTINRISGKTHLKGGKIQLNCDTGVNMLVDKDTYKVGDSIAIADGKIKDHFPMNKGASVLVIGGTHIGSIGTIDAIEGTTLTITAGKNTFQTMKHYAYVVGKEKSAITLG